MDAFLEKLKKDDQILYPVLVEILKREHGYKRAGLLSLTIIGVIGMICIFAVLVAISAYFAKKFDHLKNKQNVCQEDVKATYPYFKRMVVFISVLGIVGTVGLTSLGIVILT